MHHCLSLEALDPVAKLGIEYSAPAPIPRHPLHSDWRMQSSKLNNNRTEATLNTCRLYRITILLELLSKSRTCGVITKLGIIFAVHQACEFLGAFLAPQWRYYPF